VVYATVVFAMKYCLGRLQSHRW